MGGCAASKLDNEDTVRRCKERRRFMKEAVHARHNLATAHSDYLRSLRLTGSALFDFASGEPLSISDQTPAVLLRNPSSISSSFRNPPPPPPQKPKPRTQTPSLYSSSSPLPTVSNPKLPHILSESSPSSTPFHKPSKKHDFSMNFPTNSNFSSTPSQASSVWNWENFYPPSPPGSDFFQRLNDDDDHQSNNHHEKQSNIHHEKKKEEEEEEEETETEREEVQCSEWGDHYSTTSSDTKSDNEDLESRSEIGSRSNFGSSVHNDIASKSNRFPMKKADNSDDAGSSVSWNIGSKDEVPDMKMVVRHRNLAEIAAAIKDYFENAATAGESVSDLLETGRAQLDRSFRQLKSE